MLTVYQSKRLLLKTVLYASAQVERSSTVSLVESIVIVIGLVVFEVVNSKDNAIFNANILKTMSMLWRKRFLLIGIIKSMFLVRFLLPKLIPSPSTNT